MLFENFDFNSVKDNKNKNKNLSNTIHNEINKHYLDECIKYLNKFIVHVVYPGFVAVDTKIHVEVDYDELQAHFNIEGFSEEFIIKLVSEKQIAIYSGLHGCLDITPIVFELIKDSEYEVVELGRLIDGKIEGIWLCHDIMNCGSWLDYQGYNHYLSNQNYIELDQDFINKFKKIKFTPIGKNTVVGINKGWVFQNEAQYNEFWDKLHQVGYTGWEKYKIHQKFNMHQMEIARYQDARHTSSPIGAYYIKGVKRPKRI